MSKKRGKIGFNPENPNVIDDISKMNGFKLTADDIKAYKKARTNALAKARRLKAKGGDAWIGLGGLELENKQKGKDYEAEVINKYIDAKSMSVNPTGFATRKLFENELERMRTFASRGGEFKELDTARERLIKSIDRLHYPMEEKIDIVEYIKRMPSSTFAQLLSTPEIYTTIKDVYLEEDNPHYLEEFKTYIGYNVYSGEETEKQWSSRFKAKYGRDVTL